MQITHEEAHRLIQLHADQALNAGSQAMLSAHLQDCSACQVYAQEIKEVESLLRPVMQRHWNVEPGPHSLTALQKKHNYRTQAFAVLAMRTALVSLFLVAFVLGVQSVMQPSPGSSSQQAMAIPPVPTPSVLATTTKSIPAECEVALYTVQAGDTLERLAAQFALAKEELIAYNRLRKDTLAAGMELEIPVCGFTATGTVIATLFTRTEIPFTGSISSTTGPGQ